MPSTPFRSLEIIAGTPPGGGQDRAARALAEALLASVTVTNVPGRGGGNAWDALVDRPGDADVVSISSPTLITNRVLGIADIDDRHLTPIAHLCTEHLAFVVPSTSSMEEPPHLLEAMAEMRLVTAIATERGNVNHIALGRVVRASGADPSEAPVRVFDSARHAIADVLEGESQLGVVSAASTIPELGAGAVRVVAVSAGERMPVPFDTVPVWADAGVDCVIGTWRGVVGPASMSDEAIDAWDQAIAEAVDSTAWRAAIRRHRWVGTHLGRRDVVEFLRKERVALVRDLEHLKLTGSDDG